MAPTDANRLGRVGMVSIHDAKKLDASVLLLILNLVDVAVNPLSGFLVYRLNHVAKADRVEWLGLNTTSFHLDIHE